MRAEATSLCLMTKSFPTQQQLSVTPRAGRITRICAGMWRCLFKGCGGFGGLEVAGMEGVEIRTEILLPSHTLYLTYQWQIIIILLTLQTNSVQSQLGVNLISLKTKNYLFSYSLLLKGLHQCICFLNYQADFKEDLRRYSFVVMVKVLNQPDARWLLQLHHVQF